MKIVTQQHLLGFLEKNNYKYNLDTNPTPEKVSKIKDAIQRKEALMNYAIDSYKKVFRIA